MFWKNMELRNKLILGFFIMLVLIICTGILAFNGIGSVKEQSKSSSILHEIDSLLAQKEIDQLTPNQLADIIHSIHQSVMDNIVADEEILKNIQSTQRNITIISFIAIIMVLLLAYWIISGISLPVARAIKFAEQMTMGDFTGKLTTNKRDEVGHLAEALNNLVTNLGRIFREINNGVFTLDASSTNLNSISEQMKQGAERTSARANTVAAAAEEMSFNMSSVADASELASTNVNMAASSVEEMSVTLNEIAKNTDDARIITEKAVSQTHDASLKVDELGVAAAGINQVTETINDISEQTNLLALNATIEAARAGEAGKGFAVVASEIKELAKQTAEATQAIKEKVNGIQQSTSETIENIKVIAQVNNDVNDIVVNISNAVEEQSSATREIAQNITQASDGIQEVNSNVIESSYVSNDLSEDIASVRVSADEMSTNSFQTNINAQDLQKISKRLSGIMDQFELSSPLFDMGAVKGAILKWRYRLEALLHGEQSLTPEEVSNHHKCDFGKWYDGAECQKFKELPLFVEIGKHHKQVHAYAQQMVDVVRKGDQEKADFLMEEFEKVRGKLFESLNDLYLL